MESINAAKSEFKEKLAEKDLKIKSLESKLDDLNQKIAKIEEKPTKTLLRHGDDHPKILNLYFQNRIY